MATADLASFARSGSGEDNTGRLDDIIDNNDDDDDLTLAVSYKYYYFYVILTFLFNRWILLFVL
jgi:hypothetical protein